MLLLRKAAIMRKCPFCSKENYKEKYFCEACGSYLGSEHPDGLPPSPSDKAKALMQKQASTAPAKKRSRKEPEYVRLYHGPKVKKSTAKWLEKKQANASTVLFGILGFMLLLYLCGLVNR
jgi:hypothetical protein